MTPLTVQELAAKWEMSTAAIKKMIKEGRLPAEKVGRSWRIPADVAKPAKKPRQKVAAPPFAHDPIPSFFGLTPVEYKAKFGSLQFQEFVRQVKEKGSEHPYYHFVQTGRGNGYKLPEEAHGETEEVLEGIRIMNKWLEGGLQGCLLEEKEQR